MVIFSDLTAKTDMRCSLTPLPLSSSPSSTFVSAGKSYGWLVDKVDRKVGTTKIVSGGRGGSFGKVSYNSDIRK